MLTCTVCCIALLTGCGGGSGGDDNNDGSGDGSGNGGSSSVNGVDPVVSLTETHSSTYKIQGKEKTTTIQSGYDGDIEVATKTSQAGANSYSENFIKLSDNVPSLNVTDIQKTIIVDMSCENGYSVKGTRDHDFSSGKVATSGTFNGKTYSCESLYQSPLATTVTSSSLEELLEDWGDDEDDQSFISSTCPEDDDNDPEFNPFVVNCSGSLLTNYTITTSDPTKTHKISTKLNWK